MLKIRKKLQEKRFVFVKILAIIIPENGAKVSKIKCLRLNQQTLGNAVSIIQKQRPLLFPFLAHSRHINPPFRLKIKTTGKIH